LPLGLIGGIGFWLYRRSAAAGQGQERG